MKTLAPLIILLFFLALPAYAKDSREPSAAPSSSTSVVASSAQLLAPLLVPFSVFIPSSSTTTSTIVTSAVATSSADVSPTSTTISSAAESLGTPGPPLGNPAGGIYSLSHRFSTETTRLFFEVAMLLGVTGFLLVEAPGVRLVLKRVWG